ncbi:MAG: betaine/proline/choline family ABC transporter ATP-binding protein [Candidatus Buchananbacteria bacterium]|nr:betaine/proline/choline family ABC transporter ATP-binding protein [Candidatus Buchananbacteria bacterium]
MSQNSVKIQIENLYKIFGSNQEEAFSLIEKGKTRDEIQKQNGALTALRNISFDVKEKEIFVIMGLSGSGKSTLLRCINRLQEPTKGIIKVNNEDITCLNEERLRKIRRTIMGMVFQSFALFPHMSVLKNVIFGLEIRKNMDKDERLKKGEEVLKIVGLDQWKNKKVDELSGGMKQRVGLARALAIDPEILLMDEPFSALDPLIRTNLQNELLSLQEKMGKTILFVTHDLNEAIKLGDRIAILNSEGELVQIDTPENILLNPADEYVKTFISDVDRPAVIRLENVMNQVSFEADIKDSVDEVFAKMKKNNAQTVFVTDKGLYRGIVTQNTLSKADKETIADLIVYVKPGYYLASIKDILPNIITKTYPLPVVDKENYLIGEIRDKSVADILKQNI